MPRISDCKNFCLNIFTMILSLFRACHDFCNKTKIIQNNRMYATLTIQSHIFHPTPNWFIQLKHGDIVRSVLNSTVGTYTCRYWFIQLRHIQVATEFYSWDIYTRQVATESYSWDIYTRQVATEFYNWEICTWQVATKSYSWDIVMPLLIFTVET